MKTINKYGGFDNYVLMAQPEKLDSIYGEYLRRIMLKKLNDPGFKVPHLVKQAKFTPSKRF